MSHTDNNNHDQNIFLHIGPHFEIKEVKRMKNSNKLNITCCKSSQGKVNIKYIQGLSQRRSENNGLLLPKYESEGLPDPTGGSTDVVHLLI